MAQAWFPFYFGDYSSKTEHLSLAEHGAYLLLMGSYYKRGCKLPANAMQLQKICRVFAQEEVDAMHNVLNEFFDKREDGYYHERIEQELSKQSEISKKRSDAAKKRHQKDANAGASGRANAGASAKQVDVHLDTQSQSQSQLHTQSREKEEPVGSSKKKGSRLSPLWVLPEDWLHAAKEISPQIDIKLEADKFRDYWVGVAGQKGVKLDWKATWRNWIRNANGSKPPPAAPHDPCDIPGMI